MKKILLSGIMSVLAINVALASQEDMGSTRPKVPCNDCQDTQKLPRHERCGHFRYVMHQAEQIERENAVKAQLKEQRRLALQATFPSLRDLQKLDSDNYMAAFTPWVNAYKAGNRLPITDILMPKSIIYVPCRHGMLAYRFDNVTLDVNSHMFKALTKVFFEGKDHLFSAQKSAKKTREQVGQFSENSFLNEYRKALRMNELYISTLQDRKVPMESDGDLRTMEVALDDMLDQTTLHITIAAMAHLNEWGWLTQDLLNSVENSLNKPVFVQVKDVRVVALNHMRGVR